MSDLSYGKAALLGLVQGLTEFLPVSSSAHLALGQRWIDLDPDSPTMLLFDVLVHLGTVVAVAVVFARPFRRYLRRLLDELHTDWPKRRYALRIALLGVTASVPTAAIGLGFKADLEAAFDKPLVIGVCLLVTGTLLALTRLLPRGRRGWGAFSFGRAVTIGVAQGLAILPGISRSGSTICTAMILGIRRRWAGQFSFFIAVPAICGAAAIKFKDTLELPADELQGLPWGALLLGTLVSCLSGIVALKLLMGVVQRRRLHYFTWYCWLLGIVAIVTALR